MQVEIDELEVGFYFEVLYSYKREEMLPLT